MIDKKHVRFLTLSKNVKMDVPYDSAGPTGKNTVVHTFEAYTV